MNKTALFRALVLIGFSALAGRASTLAQSVSKTGPDRISVQAKGVPLAALVKELGEVVPLGRVIIAPEVENRPVSLTIQDVPIKEAIEKILEAAEVNHTLWGGDGEPYRIYAGAAEGAVPSAPSTDIRESDQESEGSKSAESTSAPPAGSGRQPVTGSVPGGSPPGESVQSPVPPSPDSPSYPPKPPSGQLQPPRDRQPTRTPPPRPRLATGPARPATGFSISATDAALVHEPPDKARMALTAAILGLGLLLGAALIREPTKSRPSHPKRYRR